MLNASCKEHIDSLASWLRLRQQLPSSEKNSNKRSPRTTSLQQCCAANVPRRLYKVVSSDPFHCHGNQRYILIQIMFICHLIYLHSLLLAIKLINYFNISLKYSSLLSNFICKNIKKIHEILIIFKSPANKVVN